jgi:hypothetical protein
MKKLLKEEEIRPKKIKFTVVGRVDQVAEVKIRKVVLAEVEICLVLNGCHFMRVSIVRL